MSIKISIVTPNYNQGEFLERTILSVLNQGYDNLEYIIIDGGSTDNSVEIIKKYADRLYYWVTEKDNGMYDAVNKGLSKTTGDVMGWLNSDDVLLPGALYTVNEVFETFPDVNWITGLPVSVDEMDRIVSFQSLQSWSRLKILSGQYKWIQQESTYWRRSLWIKAGEQLDVKFTLAGDFELWCRFMQYETLYSVHIALAGFRKRSLNQRSLEGIKDYLKQVDVIITKYTSLLPEKEKRMVHMIRILKPFMLRIGMKIFKKKSQHALMILQNLPPVIRLDRTSRKMSRDFNNSI